MGTPTLLQYTVNVFFNTPAVIGQHGTGVIADTFPLHTSLKFTSPVNLYPLFLEESSIRLIPTSIIT